MIFQLSGIKDLGRLACAFEHSPQPIFSFDLPNKFSLCIQFEMGAKTTNFFYLESDRIGPFLGYKDVCGEEKVDFFKLAKDTSYIYSPVISLKEPAFKIVKNNKYPPKKISFHQLKDLGSLLRIVTYKMFSDESTLPIFSAPLKSGGILFTIISYFEEDLSKIYYFMSEEHPTNNFIKYASDKDILRYTDNVDESGYVYAKIIRMDSFPFNVKL